MTKLSPLSTPLLAGTSPEVCMSSFTSSMQRNDDELADNKKRTLVEDAQEKLEKKHLKRESASNTELQSPNKKQKPEKEKSFSDLYSEWEREATKDAWGNGLNSKPLPDRPFTEKEKEMFRQAARTI